VKPDLVRCRFTERRSGGSADATDSRRRKRPELGQLQPAQLGQRQWARQEQRQQDGSGGIVRIRCDESPAHSRPQRRRHRWRRVRTRLRPRRPTWFLCTSEDLPRLVLTPPDVTKTPYAAPRCWSSAGRNPRAGHRHQGERRGRRTGRPRERAQRAARAGAGVKTQLASGVVLTGGGSHNSVTVEFKDFVTVIEGPLNQQRSLAVIAETNRTFPNKPIRYLVNTHNHFVWAGYGPTRRKARRSSPTTATATSISGSCWRRSSAHSVRPAFATASCADRPQGPRIADVHGSVHDQRR
jgi:hypothetical protein